MVEAGYGMHAQLDLPYGQAIRAVTAALKTQGFGVLTEIDVRQTLKAKLDVDTDPYIILGACNPKLAHRALEIEPEVGLLLPCNVIVYSHKDGPGSVVAILDPKTMMGVANNPALEAVAEEAARLLKLVLDEVKR